MESRWSHTRLVVAMIALAATVVLNASELPDVECLRLLRQARIEIVKGNQDEGLALLRRAVEEYPDQLVPIVVLLEHGRRLDLPEADEKTLRQLLVRRLSDTDQPVPPGVLRYLIESPNVGDDELALTLTAASARLEQSPDDRSLLDAVALLQQRLQMQQAARDTYGRLYALKPTEAARWRLIHMDLSMQRWEQAAELLAESIAEEEHLLYRVIYMQTLAKLGRHEELISEIDALAAGEEMTGLIGTEELNELLLQAAWSLYDLGKHAEAEQMFRRVLQSNSENQEARRAVLHLYSTEVERRAHEGALVASLANEQDADRLLEEGANLLIAGDAAAALPLLERATAALPESEVAWYNLGLAAFKLEDWSVAEMAFQNTVRLNPQRAVAFLNHGAALQRLGRCKEALPILARALDLDPALSQCHYYLYVCYRELKNGDKAREHLHLYESRN